jgi:signal transduction histidine kinase
VTWWDAAVALTLIACAFLVWLDTVLVPAMPKRSVAALLALAGFAVAYGAFGRWLTPTRHPVASQVYLAVMVAITAIGAAADPNLATLQVVAYPLIGRFAPGRLVGMIVWDAVLGLAVFAGLALGPAGPTAAAITAVLSLLFAIAVGVWITRIMQWGAERARLVAELQAAQENAAASAREAGAARERERLARDMHDTVAQSLTGLVMLAERAERQASRLDDTGALTETLETIEDASRETLREIRALVAETAVPSVDDGLAEAARRVAQRFERETGISTAVDFEPVPLQREHEVVLLRCLQEGLGNVRKHAEATRAWATLHDAGAGVVLEVADDGVGVTRPDDGTGFGLAGMRERVGLFGGSVQLSSAPGGGARLTVSLPTGSDTPSAGGGSGSARADGSGSAASEASGSTGAGASGSARAHSSGSAAPRSGSKLTRSGGAT